jgi:hypothetical protein
MQVGFRTRPPAAATTRKTRLETDALFFSYITRCVEQRDLVKIARKSRDIFKFQ